MYITVVCGLYKNYFKIMIDILQLFLLLLSRRICGAATTRSPAMQILQYFHHGRIILIQSGPTTESDIIQEAYSH